MKQILFVDDKPAIGKVLSVYLGKENELVYFEDPVRAIEWLNEGNEPALIISDIRMPKMTGSEFLAYLKSNSLFKDIPVVMLSSEESTTERINLLEAGAEDFAFVAAQVPSAYVFLSACPAEDPASAADNHSPRAHFDDSVVPDGALLLAELALRRLARG